MKEYHLLIVFKDNNNGSESTLNVYIDANSAEEAINEAEKEYGESTTFYKAVIMS
jgi:hypothetical protein